MGWVSGRFEVWITGGSVLAGLVIGAATYRNWTGGGNQRLIRIYASSVGVPFFLLAVLGSGLVAY